MINKIWQTPGNSRTFDCSFEEIFSTNQENYISKRSMFILNYLYDKSFHGKAMKDIKKELQEQLITKFKGFKQNDSWDSSFCKSIDILWFGK